MPATRYLSYRGRRRRRRRNVFLIVLMVLLLLIAALFTWIAFYKLHAGEDASSEESMPESSIVESFPASAPESSLFVVDSAPSSPEVPSAPPAAPIDYSQPLPAGEEQTDAYFSDAVFIGDSRTQGFILYSGLSDTTSYADKGLSVESVFTKAVIASGDKKVSVMDALAANPTFKKVYLMLGVNELGWAYSNIFQEKYRAVVVKIKEINPDAEIYVQSILPVSKKKSDGDKIYNNPKIQEYNQLIQEVAADENVFYLNVAEAVQDENGVLPADASSDGVHMNKAYCQKWLTYLKNHTAEGAGFYEYRTDPNSQPLA